ncbi:hypothetical protein AKJ49_00955 [candidate division MSBL1 archaeon SCGC-AAA382A03]|uniref:4Fe-4S ferredoxin-type domain-containing protein n=1 Tax=candidate division MSBL1 archaeon SCGC-AAA382A03 TaxID=1698278 RepID=A0A133VFZ6_9EURY|nr:hypothetical protein AKJ49_00955 [candidate division MSBL1 archaeon SCGC-AAA382A03]
MPLVIYDYNKCTGDASCADVCPVDILEGSENERWCKPIDDEVENQEAINQYYDKVNDSEEQVDVIIENEMPECVECLSCEAACPHEAISIEPS